ncbi:DUF6765 family protein [Thermodesulfobacteriota bacterium B35]
MAEILPVGHGSVATFPDRPYLQWEYKPEDGRPLIQRDNPRDYLEGCRELHKLFRRFLARHPGHQSPAGARSWQKIRGTVADIIQVQGSKEVRIQAWQKAIARKELFATKRADSRLAYHPKMWDANRIREAFLQRHAAGPVRRQPLCPGGLEIPESRDPRPDARDGALSLSPGGRSPQR